MRDRTLLQKEAVLGLQDPWYFSTEILLNGKGDAFPRPEHEMRPQLDFLCRPRPPDLKPSDKWFDYVSYPRETGKTMNALVFLTIAIIKNPNFTAMIMNEERQQASDSLRVVSDWLTSERVEQLYGKFKGRSGWEKEYIFVSQRTRKGIKDPTIITSGMDVPMEGKHPDLIIWDDLIGRNSAHRDGFLKATRRVEQSMPVLKTGGRGIYICTRWGPEDPSAEILNKWNANLMWHAPKPRGFFGAFAKPGDEKFFPHAVPGEPLFNSILPKERLEELQKTLPWSFFSSQYLNEPEPEGGAYFDQSDVQYFDLHVA
jgi:hypothetical protein